MYRVKIAIMNLDWKSFSTPELVDAVRGARTLVDAKQVMLIELQRQAANLSQVQVSAAISSLVRAKSIDDLISLLLTE